jgi:hypothetical protein
MQLLTQMILRMDEEYPGPGIVDGNATSDHSALQRAEQGANKGEVKGGEGPYTKVWIDVVIPFVTIVFL